MNKDLPTIEDKIDTATHFSMDRLCFEPKIYLVGQTAFNYQELGQWAFDHQLNDEAVGSPIDNILNVASGDPYNSEVMSEFGGRFCYRSWKAGRSTEEYIKNIIESEHNSVLRHMSFNFVIEGVSRSFSHELVRHAAGTAPSQESQRYVDAKDMKFVVPPMYQAVVENALAKDIAAGSPKEQLPMVRESLYYGWWTSHAEPSLETYIRMQSLYNKYIVESVGVDEKSLIKKRANEAARAALPNCAETRLLFTMNGDAMRHILHMRGDKHADLEIRRFAVALFGKMKEEAPNTLFDFKVDSDNFGSILTK